MAHEVDFKNDFVTEMKVKFLLEGPPQSILKEVDPNFHREKKAKLLRSEA